ncbi:MAG: hypothetical protein A3G25_18775 [Betaproteobacteria bacterium RIFCSPLOWO2_12_FULL_63_13]|nr:MAG: hypothetical protein A3G25_18775 [Betaproteobacteria bacterium RIFCSPLOWO2_12_FULL_63_13]
MHVRKLCISLATLAVVALPATPAGAEELVLKSATGLPRNLSLVQTYLTVSKEINEKAKGKLRIDYLGGPDVTPPSKLANALKRGVVDIIHCPSGYYAGVVPEGDAILASERSPAEIRANGGMALLEKIWNKALNAHILGWYAAGFQDTKDSPIVNLYNLYFTEKPPLDAVKGLNLKGMKIRSTPTYRPLLEALGATPVGMKGSEIYVGLQRGVVQGFGWPGVAITGLGLGEVVKYRVDPGFYKGNNMVIINLDTWNKLSPDLKALLDKSFEEGEVRDNMYIAADARSETAKMQKAGMQIIKLDPKSAAAYQKVSIDVIWNRLEKRVPDTAKALRAKFTK